MLDERQKCVDRDQTRRTAASDLDLHSLLRRICPNLGFFAGLMPLGVINVAIKCDHVNAHPGIGCSRMFLLLLFLGRRSNFIQMI